MDAALRLVSGIHELRPQLQQFFDERIEVRQDEIVVRIAHIRGLQEQGSAARSAGGFGILPFVTDYERMIEVQVPFEAGLDKQARLGFAAGAIVRGIVRANVDIVQREGPAEEIMHPVELAAGLITAREAGLVGGDDQNEASVFEQAQVPLAVGLEHELLHGKR